jgi:hypothetical protein
MKTYTRVAPRDLFNEAKLLKCLGRLALLVVNAKVPEGLTFYDSGEPYLPEQDSSSGDIYCKQGIRFNFRGHELILLSGLNSRELYPLFWRTDDDEEITVFNDKGDFRSEFMEKLQQLQQVN